MGLFMCVQATSMDFGYENSRLTQTNTKPPIVLIPRPITCPTDLTTRQKPLKSVTWEVCTPPRNPTDPTVALSWSGEFTLDGIYLQEQSVVRSEHVVPQTKRRKCQLATPRIDRSHHIHHHSS